MCLKDFAEADRKDRKYISHKTNRLYREVARLGSKVMDENEDEDDLN
jgi:hypothetical protein